MAENKLTCTIIGLGLIGGSIAKSIRRYHPDAEIRGYNRSPENLRLALEDKVIDYAMQDVTDRIEESDYIFLCSPVGINVANLQKMLPHLSKDCILTDVGSVKGDIHKEIEALGLSDRFIGGHPMAGSEKTGYAHSSDTLLENAYYILTPGSRLPENRYKEFFQFIESLHALPVRSDDKKHDYATAAISHVPHLIAAALVRLVEENDSPDQFMKMIAAGGFKDITRIASSSPTMWEHICRSNQEQILVLLNKYINQLENLSKDISNKEFQKIYDLFETAGSYRNSLSDKASGPIQKAFQLYLDVPDEAGAIARVATILADHGISIKNIGITHNREHSEGVLYIVFYDEKSLQAAIPVLTNGQNRYKIYNH